uniref:TMEM205-like domain-containing protein n=1 Tax=Salvator merianae TaxID=96440 RepID=A0A8D0BR98_SALMN
GNPSILVKIVHLVFLATFWRMHIWVTFASSFSCLSPYYFHFGFACAFINLIIFAICHPSPLLSEEETTQIIVFLICFIVSDLNVQWFGQEVTRSACSILF